MNTAGISSKFNYPSQYVNVLGSKMHYIEAGIGDPILLLHGIPTSNYIWRNIIPYLSPLGRCIAPDLIGFGQSEKPNISYTIFEHIKYIEKFIETLNLKKLVIIMHGWGSLIGFDYAMRNEKNCRGLVFYEAFLRSLNGDNTSLPFLEQLHLFESEEEDFEIAVNGVSFVDKILPQNSIRELSSEEMDHYRRPFLTPGSGKPIMQYLKELPHGNKNGEIEKFIADYSKKLTKSKLPKLLLYSVPGFITTIATVMWAKENLPNLEVVDIGEELHFAQESNPELLGETISVWLQAIDQ